MIRRRLAEERGFTLIETLVVAALMVGVSGAALTTLTEFGTTTTRAEAQNDAQQEARRSLGLMAQELRNLASPTNELPEAVEKATATDLVFLSVADERPAGSLNERNTRRVRYCLDTSSRTVWRQEQTWTTATAPVASSTTACPTPPADGGWGQARAAALNVTNGTRPLFTYNAAALVDITEIGAKLWIDADTARAPREVELETSAYLRNQNRGPTASFNAAPSGSQILLNGSESSDPEGKSLEYLWYDNGLAEPVGEGIVYTYTPSQPGNHSITLKVRDPAGLESSAPPQEVCITGGDTPCS